MVKKVAQRAVAAGLTGIMAFGAVAPAAMADYYTPTNTGEYWNVRYTIGGEDAADHWKRIYGSDRYGTMKAIVNAYAKRKAWYATGKKDAYQQYNVAVVASGENFPDALAANGLAGSLDCPVILTKKGALSSQAKELLDNLNVQSVFIMGGTAAVSQEVEDAIKAMNIAVARVAGADRQATSVAAFKLIDGNWYKNTGSRDLIIATGENYADALSISPYAYRVGAPIILTKADGTLTDEAVDAIAANPYIERVIIVGGKDAVKASVVDAVDKYDKYGRRDFEFVRLGGDTRYQTSAIIADWEVYEWYGNNAYGDFDFDTCYIATGENFPDALAGGQLAGGDHLTDKFTFAPLLLVKDGDTTAESVIADEIGKWWNSYGNDTYLITEPIYDKYLAIDHNWFYDSDGNQIPYLWNDPWYGTGNDYYVAADIIDNAIGLTPVGATLTPTVINDVANGTFTIYRDLGNVQDSNFYGYILGGPEAVSNDKVKSLDAAVQDNAGSDKLAIVDTNGDKLRNATVVSGLDVKGAPWRDGNLYALEYDTSRNGVDRYNIKMFEGGRWKRWNEGFYAYAIPAGTAITDTPWNSAFDWWPIFENSTTWVISGANYIF